MNEIQITIGTRFFKSEIVFNCMKRFPPETLLSIKIKSVHNRFLDLITTNVPPLT